MQVVFLTDIDLESSSVSESAYSEYDDTHTYVIDDIVYVSYESDGTTGRTPHEIYISTADANLDNYPPAVAGKWTSLGCTNRWRMFDGFVNTQTEDSDTITIEIDASNTTYVGLFSLIGSSVTCTLTVNGTVKKTEKITLDDSPVYDYWEYFFSGFSYKEDISWQYPLYYNNAVLTIAIEPYQSETKCGMCVLGKGIFLGSSRYGLAVGINDYSKKSTDSLGRTYLSQGNYAKTNDFDVWIKNAELDSVRRSLAAVRGLPIIIDANNDSTNYGSLVVYGFWKNFDIIIPGPLYSKCSIEQEGLI